MRGRRSVLRRRSGRGGGVVKEWMRGIWGGGYEGAVKEGWGKVWGRGKDGKRSGLWLEEERGRLMHLHGYCGLYIWKQWVKIFAACLLAGF